MQERRSGTVHCNGIQLYYEVHGQGEPLVLLHGFTGCGADWEFALPALAAEHEVLVPDLRGHGRSTNPSSELSFRQYALDVFAWLDQLTIGRIRAIGVSAGAKTLLHMATQQPARIEAIVLVSAAPYFPESARAIMRQMSPHADDHSLEEWQSMRARHRHGDEQIRALWSQGHALKDSYDDMSFTPPQLSRIAARTLIVHGDRDALYPLELAVEMYRAIPRAQLWIVPGGDHGPIFGAHMKSFLETACAFLRTDRGTDGRSGGSGSLTAKALGERY